MQQGEVSLAPTLALVMSTCTNMIAGLPVVGSCTWLAWQSSQCTGPLMPLTCWWNLHTGHIGTWEGTHVSNTPTCCWCEHLAPVGQTAHAWRRH
jgi:hypothetical protein